MSAELLGLIILILMGGVICFFGFQIFRMLLIISGFAVGAYLGGHILAVTLHSEFWLAVGLFGGGLIGAFLSKELFKAGVFLNGMLMGACVDLGVENALDQRPHTLLLLGAGILGGLVSVWFVRWYIIGITAIIGSTLVAWSLVHLLYPGLSPKMFYTDPFLLHYMAGPSLLGMVANAVLAIIGGVHQAKVSKDISW